MNKENIINSMVGDAREKIIKFPDGVVRVDGTFSQEMFLLSARQLESIVSQIVDVTIEWMGQQSSFNAAKACACACHENKLNESYDHDMKCCDRMNGFIGKPAKIPLTL